MAAKNCTLARHTHAQAGHQPQAVQEVPLEPSLKAPRGRLKPKLGDTLVLHSRFLSSAPFLFSYSSPTNSVRFEDVVLQKYTAP